MVIRGCVVQAATVKGLSAAGSEQASGSSAHGLSVMTDTGSGEARSAPSLGNRVTVVLGAQWGDEGKGKVVDLLAQDADMVCRCQVNARARSLCCVKLTSGAANTVLTHTHCSHTCFTGPLVSTAANAGVC